MAFVGKTANRCAMAKSDATLSRRRLAEVLATDERLIGLGVVRVAAVIALVAYQAFDLTASFNLVVQTPFWILRPAGVAALFAALGLTFAPSAQRHDTRTFLIRRFSRTWPVLAAVVLLSALLLGAFATTTPLQVYFVDRQFWLYFANLVGWPQFVLPGVYDTNSVAQTVNALLWAVPCFAYVSIVAVLAAHPRLQRSLVLPGAALAPLGLVLVVNSLGLPLLGEASLTRGEGIGLPLIAVLAGLFGLTAGFYPRHWWLDRRLYYVAMTGLAVIAIVGSRDLLSNPLFAGAIVALAGYAAIFRATRKSRFRRRCDRLQPGLLAFLLLSYPVQQFVVAFANSRQGFIGNSFLALPMAAILAYLVHAAISQILRRIPVLSYEDAVPVEAPLTRLPDEPFTEAIARSVGPAVIVLLVTVLLLAVLAMTLFAFQPPKVGV